MSTYTKKIQTKLHEIKSSKKIFLTSTGPRDTGQSDYKNRHTFYDLIKLAPHYENAGYFSVEMHGGARFHQDMMCNMLNPFEEANAWHQKLSTTLTQTLVRSTNVWGYRSYPENVIRETVKAFLPSIDVWRCFDFLNCVSNMKPLAEEVLQGGKLFEPAISFTQSAECTNEYYLGVVSEMVQLVGSSDNMVLCIKDMAGVGSPERTASLVDAILQKHPELIIHFHRHNTDGLGLPALVAAAKAGARIIDVSDDAFVRFYGQPPVRPLVSLLRDEGFEVAINDKDIDKASEVVRDFIQLYQPFESEFKGPSYDVLHHRMPGGAFPSSFEQAKKGGFLDLMPSILKGMSLGNKIIKYFDVTPGSQITWTSWAAIIQRYAQEGGQEKINQVLSLLETFVQQGQDFDSQDQEPQQELLSLYKTASDDLKKLLLGEYGPLPFGFPDEWVYRSVFQDEWQEAIKQREQGVEPPTAVDLEQEKQQLEKKIGRVPSDDELVLYLQHPSAAVTFLNFRRDFGDTSVLPTVHWLYGLTAEHPEASFEIQGKPNKIRLISVGEMDEQGVVQVHLEVNNTLMTFPVETPQATQSSVSIRMADPSKESELSSPLNGNLWRLGNGKTELALGKIYEKGEELANIEVMKTENALKAPFRGKLEQIHVQLNDPLVEGQLLFDFQPLEASE